MTKLNLGGHKITTFDITHSFGSKENRRNGSCKNTLFIQEHTFIKQQNSNPTGDVYRTVLSKMERGGGMGN